MDWYPWIVLLHVIGAFWFVFGHGASAVVSFRLRGERSPERIATLLNMSNAGLMMMYPGLLLLIIAGVLAGFMRGWWSSGWIWVAIGVLILMFIGMYAGATPYYRRLRQAVGIQGPGAQTNAPPEPMPADELARLLASPRPVALAVFGGIGLLVIIWLMILKPF